jgi:hypothetical protein
MASRITDLDPRGPAFNFVNRIRIWIKRKSWTWIGSAFTSKFRSFRGSIWSYGGRGCPHGGAEGYYNPLVADSHPLMKSTDPDPVQHLRDKSDPDPH